ncbi:MAG: hypothetical protein HRT35_27245 [Algicola sp.]|nr:hypothetical protein [Algicola sp.]
MKPISELRFNEVSFKKSHAAQDVKKSIYQQLTPYLDEVGQCNCRGLEFDIHYDAEAQDCIDSFKVYHDEGDKEEAKPLADYLKQLAFWHSKNPQHHIVFINIDLKNDMPEADYSCQIDKYIENFLEPTLIFRPSCIDTAGDNLAPYIAENGWPTLADMGSRFIFCITGTNKPHYATLDPQSRCCFAEGVMSMEGPSDDNQHIVFFNMQVHGEKDGTDKWDRVPQKYQAKNLITRTFKNNKARNWLASVACGVNILDTQKVSGSDWTQISPKFDSYAPRSFINWDEKKGTRYDDGKAPSIAIKDGIIVGVSNNLDNRNMQYVIGKISNDSSSIDGFVGEGTQYDTGHDPAVAILSSEFVIEIHSDQKEQQLHYNVGQFDTQNPTKIDWFSKGTECGSGNHPAITLSKSGKIIITYHSSNKDKLCYKVGEFNYDTHTVNWLIEEKAYDTGKMPSIAITETNKLVEVHSNRAEKELYYCLGKLDEEHNNINWYSIGNKYGNGKNPSVAIMSSGNIVEIHQDGSGLCYNIGSLEQSIYWSSNGVEYDQGEQPAVATGSNGMIVDVHTGGNGLFYNKGRGYS